MFLGIMYLVVLYILMYGCLRIFLPAYRAKAIINFWVSAFVVLTLAMISGSLLAVMFGDEEYFKRVADDPSFLYVTTAFEHFLRSGDRAFAWYMLYPIVALVQYIVTYVNMFVMHFTPAFIFTHSMAAFILITQWRFMTANHD